METKNKIITIRENLIREIEESGLLAGEIVPQCKLSYFRYFGYIDGKLEALNGAEIQRIFNYLNGLK